MARQTRTSERRKNVYVPPNNTEIPEDVISYFSAQDLVLRWVRHSINGKEDTKNVAYRMREGWEPVKYSDLPENYQSFFDEGGTGRLEGNVVNNDVMLMCLPVETNEGRKEYFEGRAKAQEDAVNANLRGDRPDLNRTMPIQNSSESKTTRGRKPAGFGKNSSSEETKEDIN